MKTITLQNRITGFLILFTILNIAIFTIILISNQINLSFEYKLYKAKLNGLTIRNTFEDAIRVKTTFNEAIKKLKETGIIENIVIIDSKKIKIIDAIPSILLKEEISKEDLLKINEILMQTKGELFFSSYLFNNTINIFIPIRDGDTIPYIVKTSFLLGNIKDTLKKTYKTILLVTGIIIILNFIAGFFVARRIITPIKTINKAAQIISKGNLEVKINIKTKDELEELSEVFNKMTFSLKKMKEMAEDANPATKLPGNAIIRESIEHKISDLSLFSVIYIDLDNFKAFNDRYGFAKGDDVIIFTAEALKEAIKTNGTITDFVGHVGGDDFIIVTIPDNAEKISNYIINTFDSKIVNFYNEEDKLKKYITTKNRKGEIEKFPIMTISLAIVTNKYRNITSYAQVSHIAAQVKKVAKKINKSVYIIDRRRE